MYRDSKNIISEEAKVNVSFQAVQRKCRSTTAAPSDASAPARRRGRAPLLGQRAPRAPRAHEQALRRDAGSLPAVGTRPPGTPGDCFTSLFYPLGVSTSSANCKRDSYVVCPVAEVQDL